MGSGRHEHLPIITKVGNISKIVSKLSWWSLNDLYLWNGNLDEVMSSYWSNILWVFMKMDWQGTKINLVNLVRKLHKLFRRYGANVWGLNGIYIQIKKPVAYILNKHLNNIIIVTIIYYTLVLLWLRQFNNLNISYLISFYFACLFNINIYAN